MKIDKQFLLSSLELEGFEDWEPRFNQRQSLNRPMRRPAELPGHGRTAAVLILVYEKDDQPHIVFTRRHEDLSKHPGQISFPGGSLDHGEQPLEAALREANEELAVVVERVEPLGELTSIYIPPSDFTVHPIVGWYNGLPKFQPQESEVAEVIEVSLEHLLVPKTLEWGDIDVDLQTLHVPYYRFGPHQNWGATAIMLSELLERIHKAQSR
jgi:8-oxo-dGTP pyrophosphatase MutT (NUDIX family)